MPDPTGDTPIFYRSPVPTAAREACLIHIHPPGPQLGLRYPLPDRPALLGRGEDCDVRPPDDAVSRQHAAVDPTPGGHAVSDLGSTNGTFVNDEPVAGRRRLRDGDYLRVGECVYRYLAGGNVEAGYHDEVYRLAVLDGLTGAHNRRALDEFLAREVARARRHDHPLSVLMLDVDHFKAVNDAGGHRHGDLVLRGLADRVGRTVRAEDLFARYGGEEFALVLVETPHPDAVRAAERVRALVAADPFEASGVPARVTVSIGVATGRGVEADATALLREADVRLYRAKRDGRDRVVGEAGGGGDDTQEWGPGPAAPTREMAPLPDGGRGGGSPGGG